MDDAELENQIGELLTDSPGLTARELSEILGIYKGTINSLLYRSTRFEKDDSTRPCWFLVETGGDIEHEVVSSPQLEVVRQPTRNPSARDFDFASLRPWQSAALNAWNENERNGLVEAVTGTGKTRLALAAIAEEFALGGKVAVIVPSIELQRQWELEIRTHFPDAEIGFMGNGYYDQLTECDILIAIVHSASRYELGLKDKELGLLVADEVHRYGAETFQLALEDSFRSRLGLTATRERPDGAHYGLEQYFGKVVYTLGYREAIAMGYIADVKVALIPVNLSTEEREQFDELSEQISATQFALSKKFGLKLDPFPKFMEEISRIAAEGELRDRIAAGTYIRSISRRKKMLAETSQKYAVMKYLAESVKNSHGTLVFTQTIDGAEALAQELQKKGVKAEPIHSELDKTERRKVFVNFESGKVKALTAATVLDEGIDVPEADLAVIISTSKTKRQMIQRMGRVLRRKKDGRNARFVFVYVADTPEDPERGAHDAFWGEVLDIATSSQKFELPREARDLTKYLDPKSK
jgi:RNA polymerase primary sigma factor